MTQWTNFVPKGRSVTMSGTTSQGTLISDEESGDHISVVLRTRPLNIHERQRHETSCLRYPGNGKVEIDWQGLTKHFRYNVVFEDTASQQDVFEHCGIKRLVELTIEGYACTCFAYGQTGSGKTHTITGPPSEFFMGKEPNPDVFGIMPRAFIYLYRLVREMKSENCRIHASYFEIYNEQIIDLLNPDSNNALGLRWQKNRGFYVENLYLIECETLDDLMGVLETGMKNRAFNSTNPNEYSSRSHSLFTIMIDSEVRDPQNPNQSQLRHGKLTFVDLAGSEKVKDGESLSSEQLQETQNINRSLLVLGNCISALVDSKKKNGHIPYRDSKLTKLLADSLGGSGVTLMIGCVSPSSTNATETINTLRYSSRAKKIQNKPFVRKDPKEEMIRALKGEIRQLRQENKYLRENVRLMDPKALENPKKESKSVPEYEQNLRSGNAFDFPSFPPPVHPSKIDHPRSIPAFIEGQDPPPLSHQPIDQSPSGNSRNLVVDNTLYAMLQEYMTENESLRSENSDLQKGRNRVKKEHESLKKENELLSEQLDRIKKRLSGNPNKDVYGRQRYGYEINGRNGHPSPMPLPPALRDNFALPAPLPAPNLPDAAPPPFRFNGAPLVHATPTPLRGIPSPPPPLSQRSSLAHKSSPLAVKERDKLGLFPQEGEQTYSHMYEARRQSPRGGSPRHQQNSYSFPRRLSPLQPLGRQEKDPLESGIDEFLDMNRSLKDELDKLDRTIRQHQRVNALNQEIRNMSRK